MKQLSKCCSGEARAANSPYLGTTNYYVCLKCGNPCDILQEETYSREDMKDFGEWCRNGLLNTEYSYEKRDKLLDRWNKTLKTKTKNNGKQKNHLRIY